MTNFSTLSRHNLPSWQLELLEQAKNPYWKPSDGFAPIAVAFIIVHKQLDVVFYSEGKHHSVEAYPLNVFDVTPPSVKVA